jgi:methylenetetrahydrofolate dehydrogenase (NADP+)/methenyltetrahydrofolate cyclohydrolase
MPVKLLKGSDLVEYISERQARQVRGLIQSREITPTLAIINTDPENLVIKTYLKFKEARAKELGINLQILEVSQDKAEGAIKKLSLDSNVHGIILQLPLKDPAQTDRLLNLIPATKDVDALSKQALVQPATAQAILWLLAGFNVELKGQRILVLGQGRLVGAPLTKLLKEQDLTVDVIDDKNSPKELIEVIKNADILISATGQAGLIKPEMLHDGQVIIDAGTSESDGEVLGDLDPSVYNSNLDLKVSAKIGGLGPLTISCLYENLLQLIDKTNS